MRNSMSLETDEFSCVQQDEFAILTLKGGAFNVLTSLESKQKLLELMANIDQANDIRGMVLINSDEYPGDEKYLKFLQQVMRNEFGNTCTSGTKVARMRHAVEQFTMLAVKLVLGKYCYENTTV